MKLRPTGHRHVRSSARVAVLGVLLAGAGVFGLLPAAGVGAGANEADAPSEAKPQYGGRLNLATVYMTLNPLSWDPDDWAWKSNHDQGFFYEQLFAADLDKSVRRGGPYRFIAEAYLPDDALRGELAEGWEWETPLKLVVTLRRGVMFPEKPGVMTARELDAEDVVSSYERRKDSPKRIPTYFDHIESVTARDERTVVFEFNRFNAEWAYRFGYGYYSGIVPREMASVDAKDWRKTTGSGPFSITRYVEGHSQTYARNPSYWDSEQIGGRSYGIPFIDEVKYWIIKDEATAFTALRTGKVDVMEAIRWIVVDHLRKTTPELQWSRYLTNVGVFVALRVDREPFGDRRVRRALNLAVNQPEIVELFFGGHAELMAYPQHPGFGEAFQPLDEMPESVQELFTHDPEKARRLLAEAGYPDGFSFEVQVNAADPSAMDLLPLVASYLERVGVTMEIRPLEYAAFLSTMTTRTHGPGYMLQSGHVNPTTTLRKSFVTGQTWNPSMWSDPEFDARMEELFMERDEAKRIAAIRELTVQILDEAPYIWLPSQYLHTAWWPWVKNYNGELRAGAVRPAPIYARLWIDQELKRSMGFE